MPVVFAFFSGPLPWLVLAVVTVVCLWVDLHFFARGREPTFREGVIWSIGWLVVSLLAAVVVLVLSDADDAVTYTTVYFIERSLSLDNLFVFLLLFSYFGIAEEYRARLLFWGIAAALVLRGLAILGGVALIEQFQFVIYVLGVLRSLQRPHHEADQQRQDEPADRPDDSLAERRLAPAREPVEIDLQENDHRHHEDRPGK